MTDKRAVLVLGMHRSGTSAVSRFVNMLGFDLGEHLMEAREDNPKGFWENSEIVRFNEELMAADGIRWDSLELDISPTIEKGSSDKSRKAAREILQNEFSSDQILIKDPRLCRLLPVWQEVLADQDFDIVPIAVMRDPTAVARSLETRDMMPTSRGLLLWLLYILDVMHHLSDPPILIDYDLVMNDAEAGLAPLEQLDTASYSDMLTQFRKEFLSSELYHHSQQPAANKLAELTQTIARDVSSVDVSFIREEILPAIVAAYVGGDEVSDSGRLYDELSASKAHGAQLDLERTEYDRYVEELKVEIEKSTRYVDSLKSELDSRSEYVDSLKSFVEQLESDIDEKDTYIASIKDSLDEKQSFVESLQSALGDAEKNQQALLESIEKLRTYLEEKTRVSDEYVASLTFTIQEKDEYILSLKETLDDGAKRYEALEEYATAVKSSLAEGEAYIERLELAPLVRIARKLHGISRDSDE